MSKRTEGRVVIPISALDRLRLAKEIYDNYVIAGNDNELDEILDYSWAEIGPKIIQALEFHEEAVTLRQKSEDLIEKRNNLLVPIMEITRATSTYLKAKHRGNSKHLGLWGYTVDDTPKRKKKVVKEDPEGV